jgi:hypothetical protein
MFYILLLFAEYITADVQVADSGKSDGGFICTQ